MSNLHQQVVQPQGQSPSSANPKQQRIPALDGWCSIAMFLVVGICTLTFALTAVGICASLLTGNNAGERDFVSYWAAGSHPPPLATPYGVSVFLPIERYAGLPAGLPAMIMRNPPSALLLTL